VALGEAIEGFGRGCTSRPLRDEMVALVMRSSRAAVKGYVGWKRRDG